LKTNVIYKLPRPSGTPSKFEGDIGACFHYRRSEA